MISATDLVLVCVWPRLRDRELARLLGWYRIPFARAPRVIAVDALAFYQPRAAFGPQEGGKIVYAARVLGHELTTRLALLRDEPNHPRAHEEYYKLQIGPLWRLPHPVPSARWKRFAFFYTTGERLLAADSLDALVVRDEERRVLWRALRERAAQPTAEPLPAAEEVPPEVLAALLGLAGLDAFD